MHSLIKPVALFFAGLVSAFLLIQFLQNPKILETLSDKEQLKGVESQVKEEVYKKEEKAAKSVTQTILEKVLPAASENPIFAPVLEAKRDVEYTVGVVKSLPEDQKQAVCKQVCGE